MCQAAPEPAAVDEGAKRRRGGGGAPATTSTAGAATGRTPPEFLTEAAPALCVAVCAVYLFLGARGAMHLRRIVVDGSAEAGPLFDDFRGLLAVYAAETLLVTTRGVTTMYHWTARNFLEHHLPLVVVGGCMLACCASTDSRALMQHAEWVALVLLISFNEASAALLILWPDPTFQALRIGPNLLIQTSLLATELYSYARAVRRQAADRDPRMWVPLGLTQFLLLAAFIHVSYIGQIARSCRKKSLAELDVAAKGLALVVLLALALFAAPPRPPP